MNVNERSNLADGRETTNRTQEAPKLKSIDLKKEKAEAKKRTDAIEAQAKEKMMTPELAHIWTS